MELYNSLINETRGLLEKLPQQSWAYNPRDCWADNGSSELVLQKDSAFELGASGKGSANYVLFTSDASLVPENQVILCGKDLKEIKGDCDFARIVLLRIGVLDDDDEQVYRTLRDIEFSKYHVYPKGYMVRISPESYRERQLHRRVQEEPERHQRRRHLPHRSRRRLQRPQGAGQKVRRRDRHPHPHL